MVKAVLRIATPTLIVCSILASALGIIAATNGAGAENYPGGDCDNNAVIRCGVSDNDELKSDYEDNQGGNVQAVYAHFGMDSASDLDGMVRGRVTKSGDVYVGSEKVATNAITTGRKNFTGSTPILDGQFYERPPSVSFVSNELEALVKMDDQEFKYAVLMSCGNPVKATTIKTNPEPEPEPEPTPVYSCDMLEVTESSDRTVTATLTTTAEDGATFKDATYDWGDGSSTRTADRINVTHIYEEPGEYDITATAHFTIDGEEISHTPPPQSCAKTVEFEEPEPEPEPGEPAMRIRKDVRVLEGGEPASSWEPEQVEANRGDEVEFRVVIENTGDAVMENVRLQDTLPEGFDFRPNQILRGSTEAGEFTVNNLFGNGIELGDITDGASREVIFSVKVSDDTEACGTPLRNIARAEADGVDEERDDAKVRVCVEDDQPPAEEEPEDEPEEAGQVKAEQTPTGKNLPATGAASVAGAFSITSVLGFAAYRLKELYLSFLR